MFDSIPIITIKGQNATLDRDVDASRRLYLDTLAVSMLDGKPECVYPGFDSLVYTPDGRYEFIEQYSHECLIVRVYRTYSFAQLCGMIDYETMKVFTLNDVPWSLYYEDINLSV